MAIDFKKPTKKTMIIAIIVIIAIIAIAITGTVVFLKDRGSTEAANLETNQVERPENENEQIAEENQVSQNVNETENQTSEISESNGETSTNSESQITTGAITPGGTTSTTTDQIQETTIISTETVITEKPWKTQETVWTPMNINADLSSIVIDSNRDRITVEKIAETSTGENLTTQGEEITYKIIIRSEKMINGIIVKDSIPEQTSYVSKSADNDAQEVIENEKVVGLIWNIDITENNWNNEENQFVKILSFKVKVDTDAEGTIVNNVLANGNEDEEKTSIITATKTAKVEGKTEKVAKIGDIITYTISVKNTGDLDGTTIVKDKDLAKILENASMQGNVLVSNDINKYSSEDLIKGIKIVLNKNSEVNITFSVKVTNIDGKIENIALIGDNDKPTDPEIIDTINANIVKKVKQILRNNQIVEEPVKVNDKIIYDIVVTNTGNKTLNIKVEDLLENHNEKLKLYNEKGEEVEEIILNAGETNILTATYIVKQQDIDAQQKIINIGKIIYDNEEKESKVETPVEVAKLGYEATKTADKEKVTTAGEVITYTITVKNTGNTTLKNIQVVDEKIGLTETIAEIPVGEERSVEGKYTVTQKDIDNGGKIKNVATVGDKTPSVEVPVEQKPGIQLIKSVISQDKDKNGKYEQGEIIKYNVNVKNIGNTTLTNIVVNDSNSEEKTRRIDKLVPGESKNVEFTHIVTEKDVLVGKVINTAIVGKTPSNTVTTETEKQPELDLTVIPTSTETTTITTPQNAILVLDFSSSMKGPRIEALKEAVNEFLDNFLANGKNKVKIIEYDKNILKETKFTSNRNELDISKDETGSGTNIDYGLTVANKFVTKENASTTSVILMSDGSPYNYYNDDTNKVDSDSEKNYSEARESAQWIKSKGARLFTIGFNLKYQESSKLMQDIATSQETYYQAFDGEALKEAFKDISETITTTTDENPIYITTIDGKATIKQGFKEGQKVEIYIGNYIENTSKPIKTYTWNEFIKLSQTNYSQNVIIFNLRDYIDAIGISDKASIYIRFVDETKRKNKIIVLPSMNDCKEKEEVKENIQKSEIVNTDNINSNKISSQSDEENKEKNIVKENEAINNNNIIEDKANTVDEIKDNNKDDKDKTEEMPIQNEDNMESLKDEKIDNSNIEK